MVSTVYGKAVGMGGVEHEWTWKVFGHELSKDFEFWRFALATKGISDTRWMFFLLDVTRGFLPRSLFRLFAHVMHAQELRVG